MSDNKIDKLFNKALASLKAKKKSPRVHGVKTRTIKIYSFDELSPKAQKKAIEIYRDLGWHKFDTEEITEMFQEQLREKGLPYNNVQWSLSYSQGDGVAFYGKFDLNEYVKKNKLRTKYKGLSNDVLDQASAEIEQKDHRYSHYNTMRVVLASYDALTKRQEELLQELENEISENVKDVSRELEKIGYEHVEFRNSDESIKDMIEANDYEFLEDGTRA